MSWNGFFEFLTSSPLALIGPVLAVWSIFIYRAGYTHGKHMGRTERTLIDDYQDIRTWGKL